MSRLKASCDENSNASVVCWRRNRELAMTDDRTDQPADVAPNASASRRDTHALNRRLDRVWFPKAGRTQVSSALDFWYYRC